MLTRNDRDDQVIKESDEKLDAYDMKEEKIFNDYAELCNTDRTYEANAEYNGEAYIRMKVMHQIFKNYLSYKIDMSSSLMCQNNENKLCKIIALLTSTHESVRIFEFQPSCINGQCHISTYNIQDSQKILFGVVPTIFVQLEDKIIQADPSSQINPGPYNFITNE
ncbi:uncharacterized protein LOC126909147 [Daktulosphaira vitifoliae]|uniref:uncharacterized protein LOC126909147 n=1 Tax=Daktulosphaira vitifoliae TaxID=58002 RepID=UPI0021A9C156|nr:uncharacterized protein LOC126909147 [Daktulosphaira vitifoliae]